MKKEVRVRTGGGRRGSERTSSSSFARGRSLSSVSRLGSGEEDGLASGCSQDKISTVESEIGGEDAPEAAAAFFEDAAAAAAEEEAAASSAASWEALAAAVRDK